MYIENARARTALESAAQHAANASTPLPFLWDGSTWTTPTGERRDLALIRRGIGEWLADLAEANDPTRIAERIENLRSQAKELHSRLQWGEVSEAEEEQTRADAHTLAMQADSLERTLSEQPDARPWDLTLRTVAEEMLSSSNGRAEHLLSLASQFDAFRAPMRDPADWVKSLGDAPRSIHVRTSTTWEAFCTAEPGVVRSLGTTGTKRALYAAMDRRFGARRKLGGYEGWRGVALDD
jgi:hypothetical protein